MPQLSQLAAWRNLVRVAYNNILVAEDEGGDGATKKASVKRVLKKIMRHIDIPWIPEWLEQRVESLLIDALIDTLVEILNSTGGWLGATDLPLEGAPD